ncbi:12955_t:CDS:2 [Ambispora gerdemannii]|uniref:12955_t:CDS:1 n=1 Tax=Ambispora gerdemannii TaxID=144530 RepID=A0A9N8VJY0_9GLOM|nr:12955_t:CDS:2 [Ambispora gerdemannii]
MPEKQTKLNKNETPSFEEFMKTYEGEEGVIDNYKFEVDGYGNIG